MFKKRIDMNKIPNIQPTSIASLKTQCLMVADGDISRAKELYDYFSMDLELPAFDPQKPTNMEKIKSIVGDGVSWVRENQDGLIQAITIARGLFSKGGGVPPSMANVAQAPAEAVASASAPLPPIN